MDSLQELGSALQIMWTLVCAALVWSMQAGFCCLEAGSVRHKNSVNVAIKNVVDLCISLPAFFVVGYALMFGADRYGLFGQPTFLLADLDGQGLSSFVYQAAFCSTAATIVSGGVAERCRLLPYVLVTLVLSLLIYPLFGHSVWGGGLLSQLGYHDFAGSSAVHMIGAGVTLAGIQVLGPRAGRFGEDGEPHTIPASSMPMVTLGVFILLFGWIGFNGGSAPLGAHTAGIITNTLVAAAFGGLGALLLSWAYYGMARVDLVLNGLLGGLVAITACADVVSLPSAMLVGLVGGFVVFVGTGLLERMRLDDAVGAIPVHGMAGFAGILLTAALGRADFVADSGLSRTDLLLVQSGGAAVCAAWSYGAGYITWKVIGAFTKLRVGRLAEDVGMNFSEHGVESPVQALTSAASAAARGVGSATLLGDSLPDAQHEALACAIRELAESRRATPAEASSMTQSGVRPTHASSTTPPPPVRPPLPELTELNLTLQRVAVQLERVTLSAVPAGPGSVEVGGIKSTQRGLQASGRPVKTGEGR